ncbi:MAG TPA: hypothetical protein VEU73_08510 [Gemmatimonadales bacterium]|nr:hypothetical protein [Gemmatimonadales bacterium]
MRLLCETWLLLVCAAGLGRAQSGGSALDRSQAKADADRLYQSLRHADPVTRTSVVDLVIDGWDPAASRPICTDGDSINVLVVVRHITTDTKQDVLMYVVSTGRTWRYVEGIRLLVDDDWLLIPRQVAAPPLEFARLEHGVIETSAHVITGRQLLLMRRANSVQMRVIAGSGLCDVTLGPVSQELMGLFVERELRAAWSAPLARSPP